MNKNMNAHKHGITRLCTYVLAAVCCMLATPQHSAAKMSAKDYSTILSRTAKMDVAEVVAKGDAYKERGCRDTALVYYLVACNRPADRMDDSDRQQCALAHNNAGNIYYESGNYAGALDFYIKGLRLYGHCKEQKDIGRFYNNIGTVYCTFQDYEKGMSYYRKGLALCIRHGDQLNEYKTLINMTGISTFMKDTKSARRYHGMAEKLKDNDNPVNNFMSRFNMALILITEGQYRKSNDILFKAIEYARRNNIPPNYACSAYQQIYKNYTHLGKRDSTLKYMERCERLSEEHNMQHMFVTVLHDYAQACDQSGNTGKANALRREYMTLTDSIYDMRDFDMVKNTLFLYEMENTNKQIATLNAKEKARLDTIAAQRKAIAGIGCVAIVIAVLLGIVYRQKKRLSRSYNDLFTINRDFIASQEEMKKRIRELRTRLKKNEEPADVQRYQTSNLNDEQSKLLLDAIVNVMENTTEFCSTDFSLSRMAELVGSNSKYVSQVVNDRFGKNFSNFVNEYRIHLACLRLSDNDSYSNYTLRAIGESVGFKSYTAFSTVFRRITGITPSVYQNKTEEQSQKKTQEKDA